MYAADRDGASYGVSGREGGVALEGQGAGGGGAGVAGGLGGAGPTYVTDGYAHDRCSVACARSWGECCGSILWHGSHEIRTHIRTHKDACKDTQLVRKGE